MPEPGLPGFVVPPTPPGFSSSLELGAAPEPPGPDTLLFLPVDFFLAVVLFFDVPPAASSDVFFEVACSELLEVVVFSVCVVHDAINATPSRAVTVVRRDFFIGK